MKLHGLNPETMLNNYLKLGTTAEFGFETNSDPIQVNRTLEVVKAL